VATPPAPPFSGTPALPPSLRLPPVLVEPPEPPLPPVPLPVPALPDSPLPALPVVSPLPPFSPSVDFLLSLQELMAMAADSAQIDERPSARDAEAEKELKFFMSTSR
jgi:hypothetical protein